MLSLDDESCFESYHSIFTSSSVIVVSVLYLKRGHTL